MPFCLEHYLVCLDADLVRRVGIGDKGSLSDLLVRTEDEERVARPAGRRTGSWHGPEVVF
jgi:hypothetical protein